MTYKREKRVRPVLVVKPLPEGAKKFEKYYVGVNQDQYIFEFPNRQLTADFIDEVGGLQIADKTCVLEIEVEEKKAKAQKDMKHDINIFLELQKYLNDLLQQKLPYLRLLGAGHDASIVEYFKIMWERDFWRDKYFKEHDKRG